MYRTKPVLPLATVLLVCPNLIHLSYTARGTELQGVAASSFSGMKRLASLILNFSNISMKKVKAILSGCPELKALSMYRCRGRTLKFIEQMQLPLQVLCLNRYDHGGPAVIRETQRDLRELCIGIHPGILWDDILSYVGKSGSTLRVFRAAFPKNGNIREWGAFGKLQFDALSETTLSFGSNMRTVVMSILEHAPALTTVTFFMCDLTADIFKSLAGLDTLQKLCIDTPYRCKVCSCFPGDTQPWDKHLPYEKFS